MSSRRRFCLALVPVIAALGVILTPGSSMAAPSLSTNITSVTPSPGHTAPAYPVGRSTPPREGVGPTVSPHTAAPGALASTTPLCTQPLTLARNVLANCEQPGSPHNETAVAVNPLDPLNFVASANDYQFFGPTTRTLLSRAHVSFNAGRSWADYPIPYPSVCTFTGDPTIAFDADGVVYIGSLCEDTSSVLVTRSTDGGRTWSDQVVVAAGTTITAHDHPVLAAWGDGNVIVTWVPYTYTDDSFSQVATVPVMAAVSHDGAQSFGPAQNVSGSLSECVGLTAPHACDQTWGNAVTVARDGTIYATFYNTTQYAPDGSTNLGRNRHFAVRLNPDTGALAAGPFFIGLAYDGINEGDFPVNLDSRQTLQDSQLRILMQGNITVDPFNPRHVAVVWFDNRSGPRPVSTNPYQAVTDSDIIVSQSYDSGTKWSPPTAIQRPGDQFFPWATYDNLGHLRIGFMDRSYDPQNHKYGYSVATEVGPGTLKFRITQVTTVLSDPTRDNRFSSVTVDPAHPHASRFIGDYSGLAAFGTGVVAAWTDQRNWSCLFTTPTIPCGHGEDTFTAVMP